MIGLITLIALFVIFPVVYTIVFSVAFKLISHPLIGGPILLFVAGAVIIGIAKSLAYPQ